MGKRVAIVQSNYIPWKGYFDLINSVDEFILYDDVQYTRRDWRNRNQIKTAQGIQWLTIPVEVKGKYTQLIRETMINNPSWAETHWKTLSLNYAKASFFKDYRETFEKLYLGSTDRELSQINFRFIEAICAILGIRTKISWSMNYRLEGDKTERLLRLCQQAGATAYLSGPAAKAYMEENLFSSAGIALSYMDYSGYCEYPQLHPPFNHFVTVLDLIFNVGPEAKRYLKTF